MTEQDRPFHIEHAIITPIAVTTTKDGHTLEATMDATSRETAQLAAEVFAQMTGAAHHDQEPPKKNNSTSIGFGGTVWRASWTPSADLKRAARAGAEAAKKPPPPNPRNN